MQLLGEVRATDEQLQILTDTRSGTMLIHGAAGSGKTTTALLRLRQLCNTWLIRRERVGMTRNVRMLVLTFNRTLEGYVGHLAQQQIRQNDHLELAVSTFGKFSRDLVPAGRILDQDDSRSLIEDLAAGLPLPKDFAADEVSYVLGRFQPADLDLYLTARREGRGRAPRMDETLRRRLLEEVIRPYIAYKSDHSLLDWNDLAVQAQSVDAAPWDVVIIDEAQDFSANQVRTVLAHLAEDHSITFVMDSAQRIYPQAFQWVEVGLETPQRMPLKTNYRNTKQIAAFARTLVQDLKIGDDGELPNLAGALREGALPNVLSGYYNAQVAWAIEHVVRPALVAGESVAFLKPRGGNFFSYLASQLDRYEIPWVTLTRASEWPTGPEEIALCTLHSAKGLEFDHVVAIGLSRLVTPHGTEEGDDQLEGLQRLLAMGIGRARHTVTLGYKPAEESALIGLLDPTTFTAVTV